MCTTYRLTFAFLADVRILSSFSVCLYARICGQTCLCFRVAVALLDVTMLTGMIRVCARAPPAFPVQTRIGVGSRGQIFKARTNEGQVVAVKVMNVDDDETRTETHALSKVTPHPHIVGMLGAVEYSADSAFLVLEFAETDLLEVIMSSKTGLTEAKASHYFAQLVKALNHCHHKKVFHGDLKPENALIFSDDVLKLCDFGSASFTQKSRKAAGSVFYAAPEVSPMLQMHDSTPMAPGAHAVRAAMSDGSPRVEHRGGVRSYDAAAADTWSLGVILYVMLAGRPPFSEASLYDPEYVRLANGTFQYPPSFSPQVISLLSSILKISPTQRASLKDIQRDLWVSPLVGAKDSLRRLRRDVEKVKLDGDADRAARRRRRKNQRRERPLVHEQAVHTTAHHHVHHGPYHTSHVVPHHTDAVHVDVTMPPPQAKSMSTTNSSVTSTSEATSMEGDHASTAENPVDKDSSSESHTSGSSNQCARSDSSVASSDSARSSPRRNLKITSDGSFRRSNANASSTAVHEAYTTKMQVKRPRSNSDDVLMYMQGEQRTLSSFNLNALRESSIPELAVPTPPQDTAPAARTQPEGMPSLRISVARPERTLSNSDILPVDSGPVSGMMMDTSSTNSSVRGLPGLGGLSIKVHKPTIDDEVMSRSEPGSIPASFSLPSLHINTNPSSAGVDSTKVQPSSVPSITSPLGRMAIRPPYPSSVHEPSSEEDSDVLHGFTIPTQSAAILAFQVRQRKLLEQSASVTPGDISHSEDGTSRASSADESDASHTPMVTDACMSPSLSIRVPGGAPAALALRRPAQTATVPLPAAVKDLVSPLGLAISAPFGVSKRPSLGEAPALFISKPALPNSVPAPQRRPAAIPSSTFARLHATFGQPSVGTGELAVKADPMIAAITQLEPAKVTPSAPVFNRVNSAVRNLVEATQAARGITEGFELDHVRLMPQRAIRRRVVAKAESEDDASSFYSADDASSVCSQDDSEYSDEDMGHPSAPVRRLRCADGMGEDSDGESSLCTSSQVASTCGSESEGISEYYYTDGDDGSRSGSKGSRSKGKYAFGASTGLFADAGKSMLAASSILHNVDDEAGHGFYDDTPTPGDSDGTDGGHQLVEADELIGPGVSAPHSGLGHHEASSPGSSPGGSYKAAQHTTSAHNSPAGSIVSRMSALSVSDAASQTSGVKRVRSRKVSLADPAVAAEKPASRRSSSPVLPSVASQEDSLGSENGSCLSSQGDEDDGLVSTPAAVRPRRVRQPRGASTPLPSPLPSALIAAMASDQGSSDYSVSGPNPPARSPSAAGGLPSLRIQVQRPK
jgi:serine/threonine protein kinase